MLGSRLAVGKRHFIPGRQSANQNLSDSKDGFIHIDAIIGSTLAREQSAPQLQSAIQFSLQEVAEIAKE